MAIKKGVVEPGYSVTISTGQTFTRGEEQDPVFFEADEIELNFHIQMGTARLADAPNVKPAAVEGK